jgi:hypothetical protein
MMRPRLRFFGCRRLRALLRVLLVARARSAA